MERVEIKSRVWLKTLVTILRFGFELKARLIFSVSRMSELSNLFAVLNLDAEDDKEQIASMTVVSAIDECSRRISGKKVLDVDLIERALGADCQPDCCLDSFQFHLL